MDDLTWDDLIYWLATLPEETVDKILDEIVGIL